MKQSFLLLLAALALHCGAENLPPKPMQAVPTVAYEATAVPSLPPATYHLTVIGTNDLHGHLEAMPLLAGYIEALRVARQNDGGVLLIDGGDMYQGTLESNQDEGIPVTQVYNAMGYAAAALGNHEFDFGPIGPNATPRSPGEDPFGALGRNTAQAAFAILSSNLRARAEAPPLPKEIRPSLTFDLPMPPADIKGKRAIPRVAIIGGSTHDTLTTTIAKNVAGLEFVPLATTVAAEAARVRSEERADVVLLTAHAGTKCRTATGGLAEEEGCDLNDELPRLIRALPEGTIQGAVGGHTHASAAALYLGVPMIESLSYGKAFGRFDLVLQFTGGKWQVQSAMIYALRHLCAEPKESPATCTAERYEGRVIERTKDAKLLQIIADAEAKAKMQKQAPLGVTLAAEFGRGYDHESALGNLFVDLLQQRARRGAFDEHVQHAANVASDKKAKKPIYVGMINGGGLRQVLPAGQLTFGALFEAMPFDNRVASAELSSTELADLLLRHHKKRGSYMSIGGIRVRVTEKKYVRKDENGAQGASQQLAKVELLDVAGKLLPRDTKFVVVASDFLLEGGDGFWGAGTKPNVSVHEELLRDALAAELKTMTSPIRPEDYKTKEPRYR
jgi:2',3'-cyclic-nucleotide 2'-phosphodiesterase (5'-nucleotidase family)